MTDKPSGLKPLVEDARQVAHDTNDRVKRVEERTAPASRIKRLAVFSLVMLLLYLFALSFVQSRQNGKAIDTQSSSLSSLQASIDRLSLNNQTLLLSNQQLTTERNALIAISAKQAEQLRQAGLPAVDPFDPASNGGVIITSPSPSPGVSSPKPSKGSQRPSTSSPSPAPRPTPSRSPAPRPSPSASPIAQVCAPGLPCITVPPLPILSAASFTYTKETPMDDPVNFLSYDAATVSRLLGALVPLLVAVLTRRYATSGLKAALNLVSSVVVGSATYLVAADGGYDWQGFVNASLNTLIVSAATYYGLWKPTGVAGTVAKKTESFGIGSEPELTTDDKGAEDQPPRVKRSRPRRVTKKG